MQQHLQVALTQSERREGHLDGDLAVGRDKAFQRRHVEVGLRLHHLQLVGEVHGNAALQLYLQLLAETQKK